MRLFNFCGSFWVGFVSGFFVGTVILVITFYCMWGSIRII